MNNPDAPLIDLIYEAAIIPDVWPSIFDRLIEQSDAMGCALISANQHGARWIASERFAPMLDDFIRGCWMTRNKRAKSLAATGYSGFVTEPDIFDAEEMARDDAWPQFYWPRGIGWGAGSLIPVPNGDTLIVHIERWRERGPVERPILDALDRLRPHLARATLLAARMQFERAKTAVTTLETVGLPAAVLTANGKVQTANTLFEKADGQVSIRARDRITLLNPDADQLLHNAIASLASNRLNGPAPVASLPLVATEALPPAVLHLVPIRLNARDIFSSAQALAILTPLTPIPAPGIDLLAALFDLTPAEARVARGLTEGLTLQDIAAKARLSGETVRTQLKSVLAKTGAHRQAELVALLARGVLHR